ncbi:methyltransferase domain-containing protein [Chloroflexi bacterium TSY]|nr:methyltransferase domain-containing protein [Chloroflexi bacterium TSY]
MVDAATQRPDEHAYEAEQYAHGHDSVLTRQVHTTRTVVTHASFFLPYLHPGMSLLDCGCGYGTITVGLAQAVDPGRVVGIDVGETEIDAAMAHATENNVSNIEFKLTSAYELPFPDDSFDAVFSHAMLEHLNDPLKALKEMRRVLRPGGVVGIRDADIGSWVMAGPRQDFLEQSVSIYVDYWDSQSGHSRMARQLRALLQKAEFERVAGSASCEYFGTPEGVEWISRIQSTRFQETDFVEKAIELGLTDRETLKRFSQGWTEWGKSPDSFLALTWCEAIGWKA